MHYQKRPPILTISEEILSWTLDRTADIPKSQRFTFGQRMDSIAIQQVELCLVARFRTGKERIKALDDLNILIETSRVFWRMICAKGWMSQKQVFFITAKLDEVGRMAGAWKKSTQL